MYLGHTKLNLTPEHLYAWNIDIGLFLVMDYQLLDLIQAAK
jgi:hypothetical protein